MKTKEEKKKIIQRLREIFEKAKSFILVDLTGINGEIERNLRETLKENNCQFEVVKKSLIYKAKPDFYFRDEEIKKPFAILWDFGDGISVFRVLSQISKNLDFKFNILGGFFEYQKLNPDQVWEISSLPGKEELISKIISSLLNPLQRLAFSLKYPLLKMKFALSSINQQKQK
jgi:large subunit ribosomal protein L10